MKNCVAHKAIHVQAGNFYACTRTGTACYMAPEVWDWTDFLKTWILLFQVLSRWKRYSFGADIFSFGCVIAFFVNRGKHLFPDDSKVRKWRGLRKDDIISGYSSDLLSAISSTLDPEHKRRPAARGLLQLCTKEKLKVTSVTQSSSDGWNKKFFLFVRVAF